ncbi:MAG: hypothetical protein HC910_22555 [Spirulinaceae cyanobacterium SM2_1_0]|nr:hypothetical protein [Spirulinaceae cyanobacterium SM2_1_0]
MVDFLIAQADWGSQDLDIDKREELLETEWELWEMDEWGSLHLNCPF